MGGRKYFFPHGTNFPQYVYKSPPKGSKSVLEREGRVKVIIYMEEGDLSLIRKKKIKNYHFRQSKRRLNLLFLFSHLLCTILLCAQLDTFIAFLTFWWLKVLFCYRPTFPLLWGRTNTCINLFKEPNIEKYPPFIFGLKTLKTCSYIQLTQYNFTCEMSLLTNRISGISPF